MRRVLFVITVWMLVLAAVAACAPGSAATQEPSISEQPTSTVEQPTPTHIPVDLTPAQRAALTALSEKLGLSADKIKLISTEAVTWPNGCLGIVKIGVLCTQAEVPGFKIVLEADGQKYELHTNQDGTVALLAEGAQNATAVEQIVIKQLAANLGLKESDISVVSNTEIEFPDSCLGVAMPDIMCSQIVTPGRIIVLQAKGIQYEYHVTADGDRVQPATLAMIWKREGGIAGFCDDLTVFRSGEIYTQQCKTGEGKMGTFANSLSSQEQKQFNDWMTQFGQANLDASDPQGVADRMVVTLNLFGTGSKQPTKADQQKLFEFAQNLYQKLEK
ncbi:MAG TPA: hypothetical protein VK206_04230 [Anaerolineales bacterium]|nr:hypothetical protein [Anaerolineales bacterium]